MYILTQEKTKLINSNLVSYFDVDCIGDGASNSVYANFENDAPICLGTYITVQEAQKVFEKIAQNYNAANIFYMPKE